MNRIDKIISYLQGIAQYLYGVCITLNTFDSIVNSRIHCSMFRQNASLEMFVTVNLPGAEDYEGVVPIRFCRHGNGMQANGSTAYIDIRSKGTVDVNITWNRGYLIITFPDGQTRSVDGLDYRALVAITEGTWDRCRDTEFYPSLQSKYENQVLKSITETCDRVP